MRFQEVFSPAHKAVCPDRIPSPHGGPCLLFAVAFVFLHPKALLSISSTKGPVGPLPLDPTYLAQESGLAEASPILV